MNVGRVACVSRAYETVKPGHDTHRGASIRPGNRYGAAPDAVDLGQGILSAVMAF